MSACESRSLRPLCERVLKVQYPFPENCDRRPLIKVWQQMVEDGQAHAYFWYLCGPCTLTWAQTLRRCNLDPPEMEQAGEEVPEQLARRLVL